MSSRGENIEKLPNLFQELFTWTFVLVLRRATFFSFGHQDRITGIDAGFRERAITSGGRDGTVRVWKIVEESQLVFNAPSVASGSSAGSGSGSGSTASGFVDAVKLIDEESFATCGEDG